MEGRFVASVPSYRAYRFPWSGTPWNKPALTAAGGSHPTAYASWNGATNVAYWQLLAGSSPSSLRIIGRAVRHGFETALGIPAGEQYVAVQALDSGKRALSTSPTVSIPGAVQNGSVRRNYRRSH
jgi:hypothetical protein